MTEALLTPQLWGRLGKVYGRNNRMKPELLRAGGVNQASSERGTWSTTATVPRVTPHGSLGSPAPAPPSPAAPAACKSQPGRPLPQVPSAVPGCQDGLRARGSLPVLSGGFVPLRCPPFSPGPARGHRLPTGASEHCSGPKGPGSPWRVLPNHTLSVHWSLRTVLRHETPQRQSYNFHLCRYL